jgi:hypothetical protein
MKRPFAATFLTGLFLASTLAFAGEVTSYKPDTQNPATVARKARLHQASEQKGEDSAPPLASGCFEQRSFDVMGDNDSSFDPQIGCSMQVNLSAMTENRADLVKGRGTRYSDAERAGHAVRDYRDGKTSPASSQGGSKTTSTQ